MGLGTGCQRWNTSAICLFKGWCGKYKCIGWCDIIRNYYSNAARMY